jgi:hypothetical protein
MKQKYVWEFTNQKKLTKNEFISYFERKVYKTIRKQNILSKKREITLKKSENLNSKVIKKILEKKFIIKEKNNSEINDENATDISYNCLENILKGNYTKLFNQKIKRPLYYLTDKETELYAKLTNTKGKKKKRKKEVQKLFEKFSKKNQDLEQNIIKATEQINQTN